MTKTQAELVGANVRAEMSRRSIPQRDVAAALGISQPSLSARLSGRVAFDVNEIFTVATLLGLSSADLITTTPAVAS